MNVNQLNYGIYKYGNLYNLTITTNNYINFITVTTKN